jgi:DNA processing protein
MTHPPSDIAVALALLSAPAVGERSLCRWLAWASTQDCSIADWIGCPREAALRAFPGGCGAIAAAFEALDGDCLRRMSRSVDRVRRAGGQFFLSTQAGYPRALRDAHGLNAPPVLTVIGNTALLELEAGAVVGSRTPTRTGLELAQRCAIWLASRQRTVVSGGAQGVDAAAHRAAIAATGTTIVVLPQGLLDYPVSGGLAEAIGLGHAMLLSQFVPDAPWTTGAAVTRNATIAALSRIVCVVEPRSPGGSLKTGRDALRLGQSVLVHGGSGDALIREGARPLLGASGRFSQKYLDEFWARPGARAPQQIEFS